VSPFASPELASESDPEGFRHEALLYAGDADFVARTTSFVRDGLASGEPVLIVVSAGKIAALRDELGNQAKDVRFADMLDVGGNPARIIPAWKTFVDEHGGEGCPVRGVGEPIWAARSADELVECARHEALLNLAFANAPAWWLVCPYDTQTLSSPVLDEARRNHPSVLDSGGRRRTSSEFRGLDEIAAPFDTPLPDPPGKTDAFSFGVHDLAAVRAWVEVRAAASALSPSRTEDLVLAVNEIVTNSVRHGGGAGTLRMWDTGDAVIGEIRDVGRIEEAMIGREQPTLDQSSGFGLWIANQVCDLVQVRTFPHGSVVRLHMHRG
jgi:anti-sigma regulatory factor (Ser/Thr protein kinase)